MTAALLLCILSLLLCVSASVSWECVTEWSPAMLFGRCFPLSYCFYFPWGALTWVWKLLFWVTEDPTATVCSPQPLETGSLCSVLASNNEYHFLRGKLEFFFIPSVYEIMWYWRSNRNCCIIICALTLFLSLWPNDVYQLKMLKAHFYLHVNYMYVCMCTHMLNLFNELAFFLILGQYYTLGSFLFIWISCNDFFQFSFLFQCSFSKGCPPMDMRMIFEIGAEKALGTI